MSSEQFKRNVVVRFGLPGEQGVEIDSLRVKFKVSKDDSPNPNTAEIEIWNLNKTSAALLQTPGCIVELFAGYGELVNLLFIGDVTRATTSYENGASVTKINSGDSAGTLSTAKVSASIKGKTTAGNALKAVLKSVVDDPVSLLTGLDPEALNKELPNGFSASGPLKQVLRGLARTRLFDWTYIDGKLTLTRPESATLEPAVLISPETGLIGSPATKQISSGGAVNSTKGITFKILLNATVRPRRLLSLTSRDYVGWYLTRKVEFVGDNYGQSEYFAVIDATEIKV